MELARCIATLIEMLFPGELRGSCHCRRLKGKLGGFRDDPPGKQEYEPIILRKFER